MRVYVQNVIIASITKCLKVYDEIKKLIVDYPFIEEGYEIMIEKSVKLKKINLDHHIYILMKKQKRI